MQEFEKGYVAPGAAQFPVLGMMAYQQLGPSARSAYRASGSGNYGIAEEDLLEYIRRSAPQPVSGVRRLPRLT